MIFERLEFSYLVSEDTSTKFPLVWPSYCSKMYPKVPLVSMCNQFQVITPSLLINVSS